MLVSLGMTIVIATRGIDLSVGAVMAVSGAVALTIIDGSTDPNNLGVVMLGGGRDLVSLLLGVWNGFLVSCSAYSRSSRRWFSCSQVVALHSSSQRASSQP